MVRHDVARAAEGAPLDATYLRTLSADAVPALASARGRADHAEVQAALDRALGCVDEANGVSRLNRAERRAAEVDRPTSDDCQARTPR